MYRENAEVAHEAKPTSKRSSQQEVAVALRWLTQLNEVGERRPVPERDHSFPIFLSFLGVFFFVVILSMFGTAGLAFFALLLPVVVAAVIWRFAGYAQQGHFVFGLNGVTLMSHEARGARRVVGPIPWAHVQSIEGDLWTVRVKVSEPTPRVLKARRSDPSRRVASSFRIVAPAEHAEVALSDE